MVESVEAANIGGQDAMSNEVFRFRDSISGDFFMVESSANNAPLGIGAEVRAHLRKQPIMLALLALLGIIFFAGVTGLRVLIKQTSMMTP